MQGLRSGGSICEHDRERLQCKECVVASICEHGRQRLLCKECGGSQIYMHGRTRSRYKACKCSNDVGVAVLADSVFCVDAAVPLLKTLLSL